MFECSGGGSYKLVSVVEWTGEWTKVDAPEWTKVDQSGRPCVVEWTDEWTKVDVPEWTKVDQSVVEWTKVDVPVWLNGPKWTKVDQSGPKWTSPPPPKSTDPMADSFAFSFPARL